MILYIDGGCSGNGQFDLSKRTMVSVVADKGGKIVSEVTNHGGSNNIAEMLALEHALEYALKKKKKKVHIITDSQNTIAWFNRDDSKPKAQKAIAKINDPEWYQAIKGKLVELKDYIDIELEWQGRDSNLAGHYIEEKYSL